MTQKAADGCFTDTAVSDIMKQKGCDQMETKEVLRQIRKANRLTQEEMAERLMVTRQAVSRWETGDTVPNTDTLQRISRQFHVSIHTLLGTPQHLICQCCGMPMNEDVLLSQEQDGSFNEEYCKWCYAEGKFTYDSMESLIQTCVPILMEQYPDIDERTLRQMMQQQLPQLKRWKEDQKS